MQTEQLAESTDGLVTLTAVQADALRRLGRNLASSSTWWGADDEDRPTERTLISCEPTPGGRWRVRVRDAIGVVSVPGVQIEVRPKIPLDHFLYLAAQSDLVPRLDEQQAQLSLGANLWELIARWFVARLAEVLRADLIRDYRAETGTLPFAAGRIIPMPTARHYYSGRLQLDCEYELFDADTAPNRVLRAAAEAVVATPAGSPDVRREAGRLMQAMHEVGPLQPGDLRAPIDRRATHYHDALVLARQILTHQLRTPQHGAGIAWSFLLRTPDIAETGIRRILTDRLVDRTVDNNGRQLTGSTLRLQPDLVFDDGAAVADVKYKRHTGTWVRSDLYQVTTFAAGYRTRHAALINFDTNKAPGPPPTLDVGDFHLRTISWPSHRDIDPADAATALVNQCQSWLDRSLGQSLSANTRVAV